MSSLAPPQGLQRTGLTHVLSNATDGVEVDSDFAAKEIAFFFGEALLKQLCGVQPSASNHQPKKQTPKPPGLSAAEQQELDQALKRVGELSYKRSA